MGLQNCDFFPSSGVRSKTCSRGGFNDCPHPGVSNCSWVVQGDNDSFYAGVYTVRLVAGGAIIDCRWFDTNRIGRYAQDLTLAFIVDGAGCAVGRLYEICYMVKYLRAILLGFLLFG